MEVRVEKRRSWTVKPDGNDRPRADSKVTDNIRGKSTEVRQDRAMCAAVQRKVQPRYEFSLCLMASWSRKPGSESAAGSPGIDDPGQIGRNRTTAQEMETRCRAVSSTCRSRSRTKLSPTRRATARASIT